MLNTTKKYTIAREDIQYLVENHLCIELVGGVFYVFHKKMKFTETYNQKIFQCNPPFVVVGNINVGGVGWPSYKIQQLEASCPHSIKV